MHVHILYKHIKIPDYRYTYINIDYRLKTCLQYAYTTVNDFQIIGGSVLKVKK